MVTVKVLRSSAASELLAHVNPELDRRHLLKLKRQFSSSVGATRRSSDRKHASALRFPVNRFRADFVLATDAFYRPSCSHRFQHSDSVR